MVRIIIQGIHGRMGQTLCRLIAAREDCTVVAGVDAAAKASAIPVFPSLAQVDVQADVLIDFSAPAATMASLPVCAARHLPCVVCTTGFSAQEQANIEACAKDIAVFQSANMSLGVNLLLELIQKANDVLGFDFDVEIVEKHHHNKVDAPSGTALMLADALNTKENYHYIYDRYATRAKRDVREIGMHSVRGGNIVGEHDVIFAGENEVLTLSHSALSRDVFASGAVSAAIFLANQAPGLYNMKEMIAAAK